MHIWLEKWGWRISSNCMLFAIRLIVHTLWNQLLLGKPFFLNPMYVPNLIQINRYFILFELYLSRFFFLILNRSTSYGEWIRWASEVGPRHPSFLGICVRSKTSYYRGWGQWRGGGWANICTTCQRHLQKQATEKSKIILTVTQTWRKIAISQRRLYHHMNFHLLDQFVDS